MSSDEKRNKLKRSIIAVSGNLLFLVVLCVEMVTDHPMRPLQPWNFFSHLLITAIVGSFILVGIVRSFRSESQRRSTSEVFF